MSKIILTFAEGKTFNAYENHHIEQRNRDAAIGLWCLPGRPKGVRTPRAGGHRHGLSADRHRAGLPQRGRRGQRHAEVWRAARGAIHHYQDMGFQRREKKAADSIEESLRKLRTDYVDLLLIHQPFGDYPGTWRAMERTVKEGKARAIGLSNFYADRFVDLALYANIKPAINQLMTNVFTQRWEDEREMKPYGTRLMAWGPLAQGKENLAACPQLASLAEKYGKTPQQVALRYLLERDIIAIPKSTHADRMRQNLDVFDFSLTREEVESLRPLDKPVPFSRSHRNPDKVRQYWATK